jgi:hypothetical protein
MARTETHAPWRCSASYENGFGVPQSYHAAVELYMGAAERGDPTGQHLLGLMYDNGRGVDRDDVVASKWPEPRGRRRAKPRARAVFAHPRRRRIKDVARSDHGARARRWIGGNDRDARAVTPASAR